MEAISGNIQVTRTARYFMFGDPEKPHSEIIFVLHGYGMQAKEFLQNFSSLIKEDRVIVAPEGLSRFYRKGFSGDVVASWMTREDRLDEIKDYIGYLENLFASLTTDPKVRRIVLGFSQGTSTASRWIMNGNSRVDDFILWCGEFAGDIEQFPPILPRIWHVSAQKDVFITPEQVKQQLIYLKNKGIQAREYSFDGTHVIDQPFLLKVWEDMHL